MSFTFNITDEQQKILELGLVDPIDFINNFIEVRVKIVHEELVKQGLFDLVKDHYIKQHGATHAIENYATAPFKSEVALVNYGVANGLLRTAAQKKQDGESTLDKKKG